MQVAMVYVKWPSKWWLRALRTAHQLGPRGVKGREGEVWHTCHSNGGKQPLPYLSQQLDVSVALKTAAFPAIWANFQLLAVSDLVIEFALRIALAACGALQPPVVHGPCRFLGGKPLQSGSNRWLLSAHAQHHQNPLNAAALLLAPLLVCAVEALRLARLATTSPALC